MGSKKQRKKEKEVSNTPQKSNTQKLFLVSSIIILIWGVYSVYKMRWVCDDAFITFRYVENWLNGLGLVYNQGEYVEGYTNFLLLLLLSAVRYIGLDIVVYSQYIGIIFFTGTILLIILSSYRFSMERNYFIPFSALILVFHFDFKVWGTSGLETSMYTFLILSAFYAFCLSNQNELKRILTSSTLLILAVMTRPDGALFYSIFLVWLVVKELLIDFNFKKLIKKTGVFLIPFFIIYLPYLFWKFSYYGDIYPNTYYAKAGWLSYYSQGFFYLWTYFQAYLSSWIFIFSIVPIIIFVKNSKEEQFLEKIKSLFSDKYLSALILAFILIIIYLVFFIAKVGGDFMYARFIVPIIPLIYLSGEASLRILLSKKRNTLFALMAALFFLAILEKNFRDNLFENERGERTSIYELQGIADEYWFYTETGPYGGINHIQFMEMIGNNFNYYFKGQKVNFVVMGAQACLAYYSKFTTCIENNGLTDKYIAHLPLEKRGRPGHERSAPYEYLIERKVHFSFDNLPANWPEYRTLYLRIGGRFEAVMMITYDKVLMKHLKSRFPDDVRFISFEDYLDEYIAGIEKKSKDVIKNDFSLFDDFYFKHNADSERLNEFRKYLD